MMSLISFLHAYFNQMMAVLLLLLAPYYYRQIQQQTRIKRWKNALQLQKHSQIFEQLYHDVDGFQLSRLARSRYDALDYIYGEIELLPFIALLSLANPKASTVFYDLGCGSGKAVLACAMIYPITKSVGIELLPELHACACTQNKRLAALTDYALTAAKIEFILGDFLELSLEEATFIFINSTTLFGNTWTQICTIMDQLPYLETVISTSKPLISTHFSPTITTKMQMSWGIVPVYIHHKKRMPPPPRHPELTDPERGER